MDDRVERGWRQLEEASWDTARLLFFLVANCPDVCRGTWTLSDGGGGGVLIMGYYGMAWLWGGTLMISNVLHILYRYTGNQHRLVRSGQVRLGQVKGLGSWIRKIACMQAGIGRTIVIFRTYSRGSLASYGILICR